MEHHTTTTRAEAERLLGIAEKLLRNKDFAGCKEFAILAQETEPLLDGSDQILAVAEVLLASEKRVGQHNDWYSVLQISQRTDDPELIKKQYRKLALLLHPDKNKFPFADNAFGLVAEAWNVLSDVKKKALFDNDLSVFTKVDLVAMKRQRDLQQRSQATEQDRNQNDSSQKLPVRRSARGSNTTPQASNSNPGNARGSGSGPGSGSGKRSNLGSASHSGARGGRASSAASFWTVCPYCYNLYEYARVYEGCCLRCQNCERAFTGTEISSMPPTVPGKEAYYCCWGFFPMGFVNGKLDGGGGGGGKGAAAGAGFPNWMPPMFSGNQENNYVGGGERQRNVKVTVPRPGAKKRGRPRKNP